MKIKAVNSVKLFYVSTDLPWDREDADKILSLKDSRVVCIDPNAVGTDNPAENQHVMGFLVFGSSRTDKDHNEIAKDTVREVVEMALGVKID